MYWNVLESFHQTILPEISRPSKKSFLMARSMASMAFGLEESLVCCNSSAKMSCRIGSATESKGK